MARVSPMMLLPVAIFAGFAAMAGWALLRPGAPEPQWDTAAAQAPQAPPAQVVVSVVGDLLGPAKLELGVIGPLSGQGEQAIKIGTWFEF